MEMLRFAKNRSFFPARWCAHFCDHLLEIVELAVCPKCKHIYTGPHECPTPEYVAARDQLITDACDAQEKIDIDELEKR